MPPGMTICPAASIDAPGAERGEAARRADRGDLFTGDADIDLLHAGRQHGRAAGDYDVEHVRASLLAVAMR